MSAHPEFADAIAAMALDALDAAERPALEAHLASCADCRAELDDLRRTVAGIGVALVTDAPSPSLRDRVVDAARATSNARVTPRPAPSRPLMWPWMAAAAAVILIAASSWFFTLARPGRVVPDARLAVMNAPDVVKVDLQGQPDAPGSSARVFMSRTNGLVLTAEHLPALAAGKTYQLWVVTKQSPVSIGVFTVQPDGSVNGMMSLTADATLNPVAVAVTIEPEGGVPSPTGPKVLVGLLAQH